MWLVTGSRRLTVSALLLGGAVCTAAPADATRELVRLEQQLTDALVRADVRALEPLWADDLVWIGLNGKPASKTQRLSGMTASTAVAASDALSATNTAVDVRLYGNTSVVTVRSTWTNRAGDRQTSSDYVATHVWNKRGGRWRLIAAHISRST